MTRIEANVRMKNGKPRKGKGFSRSELKKAGLDIKTALRHHFPVDPKRRTFHEDNVSVIGSVLKHPTRAPKAEKPHSKGKAKS